MEQIAEGSNLVILYLGAHSGLRATEMTHLQWKDIDFANQVLTVREGKGKKDARVIMSKSLINALEHLPGKSDYVLPCRSRHPIKQRINSLCRRASVKARGVHALRHTAGTQLRAQGVEIVEIADHLRHSSLETARGYAKVTDSVARKVVGEW
jgi:integrase/recombinase XerC